MNKKKILGGMLSLSLTISMFATPAMIFALDESPNQSVENNKELKKESAPATAAEAREAVAKAEKALTKAKKNLDLAQEALDKASARKNDAQKALNQAESDENNKKSAVDDSVKKISKKNRNYLMTQNRHIKKRPTIFPQQNRWKKAPRKHLPVLHRKKPMRNLLMSKRKKNFRMQKKLFLMTPKP